mmetsp:Transcript_12336/g.29802  ORF Transcript_12336/g.29802 Transcript_12336/m.29802 type:complete len:591 (-) Transcript_12336:78-1850(-)
MFCWEEVWDPSSASRDKDGEKCVHELARLIRNKGSLFTDPTFPPTNASLFANSSSKDNSGVEQSFRKDQDPFLAGVKGIVWKRPSEIATPGEKPVVFSGTISPDDVAQGRLGNCYFLAAISSCGIGESDELIKDLVVEDCADVGLYGIKFFIHGKWVTVVIDDLIPCVPKGNGTFAPIFSSPKSHDEQASGEMEIWSMLFEKAWAKLHLSYEATAGGHTGDTHNYLTGGSVTTYKFEDEGNGVEKVWAVMVNNLRDQNIYVSASGVIDAEGSAKDMGLVTGHAYSVLKAQKAAGGMRFVQVRNPWGSFEWNGRFSDDSDEWTPALSQELGHTSQKDGTFFMLLEDFFKWFGSIEICDPTQAARLSETSLARLDTFASCWVPGKTAGGPHTCTKTFSFNPTCKLTVTKTGSVEFSTYKRDTRPLKCDADYDTYKRQPDVSVYLRNLSEPNEPPEKVVELHGWERMESKVCKEVKAGVTYEVICATWAPGVAGMCWITVAGHGATFAPNPFQTPGREQAEIMSQEGLGGKFCCVGCKSDLTSYYNNDRGPMCKSCHTAANKIICSGGCGKDIQHESYYETKEGRVCTKCFKQ